MHLSIFTNKDIFIQKYDVNCPIIIIIITKKNSIVGAYTSNFSSSSGGNKWVGDKNDFIFSLNLNKKYPVFNINHTEHYDKEPVEFILGI